MLFSLVDLPVRIPRIAFLTSLDPTVILDQFVLVSSVLVVVAYLLVVSVTIRAERVCLSTCDDLLLLRW